MAITTATPTTTTGAMVRPPNSRSLISRPTPRRPRHGRDGPPTESRVPHLPTYPCLPRLRPGLALARNPTSPYRWAREDLPRTFYAGGMSEQRSHHRPVPKATAYFEEQESGVDPA